MRQLRINISDFALAFDQSDLSEFNNFLDTKTGAVHLIEERAFGMLENVFYDVASAEALQARLAEADDVLEWERPMVLLAYCINVEPDRFLEIPTQSSRAGYLDMQLFVGSLGDTHLAELLTVAIQGRGAFRRFKDVLARYPETQEAWYQFADARMRSRMVAWLRDNGIEPDFTTRELFRRAAARRGAKAHRWCLRALAAVAAPSAYRLC